MNGLAIAEAYFESVGKAMLDTHFPELKSRVAAGLVGMGSDCLGVDDKLSRDHDWGPGFCLWLERADFECFGAALQQRYEKMDGSYQGIQRRTSSLGRDRTGVHEIEKFYRSFLGLPKAPETPVEWLVIPEYNLAALAGGKVFFDPCGKFSSIREKIVGYYPEQVRLKKLAARCLSAARSGQYNYKRCLSRGDSYAARSTLVGFCEDILALVFLLNRRFLPYYKWHRILAAELPVLGSKIADGVSLLCRGDSVHENMEKIAECCGAIASELRNQGLSSVKHNALLDHGPEIYNLITDSDLRSLDMWYRGG